MPQGCRFCACSANDGWRECVRNRNRQRYSETLVRPCSRTPEAGHTYCMTCECEAAGCLCPKIRQHRRWCNRHSDESSYGGQAYATPDGAQPFLSEMTVAQRALARANFVLHHMRPDDDVAWQSLCVDRCPPRADSLMDPVGVAILVYAHAIKWPPAVRFFGATLPPEHEARSITATVLATAFHATVQYCDGKKLTKMHKGLSTARRTHTHSGIVVAAKQLDLLTKVGEGISEHPGRRVVNLGPAGSEYVLKALDECGSCIAWTEALIEECRAASLKWPSQGGDLPSFARPLLDLVCKAHALKSGNAGLRGGVASLAKRERRDRQAAPAPESEACDLGDGYTVKHMTRHFILAADDAELFCVAGSPRSYDDLTMQQLGAWLPDEKKQLETLWSKRAGWVRTHLGVNPLLVSCHLCFAQMLPEPVLIELSTASYPAILQPVQDWLAWRDANPDEIDCFPPNFCNLANDIQGNRVGSPGKKLRVTNK